MLGIGTPALVAAQAAPSQGQQQGMPVAATPDADMVAGEVRKIDKGAKKITLRHGEMPHLEMPAMTMVFQVKDPSMLESVKVGDKVRFRAQKIGGAFVVVELQSAQ
jgi:Cu/Ag efflux protein CusF